MTTTLDDFCEAVMRELPRGGLLDPAALARAFVDSFGLSSRPAMEELTTALLGAGIGSISGSRLPNSLRGFHVALAERAYAIRYSADEWEGAWEHTVLHETYEILRERLHDRYPGVPYPRGKRLCRDADRFAAAVLMQPEVFAPFAESSGFDVVALQRVYGRAYASVTLRLAEVMRHQPLLAALYERKERGEPSSWITPPDPARFRTTVVARTPGFTLRTQRRPGSHLRGLLPRRGGPPAPGSVVERVALSGRSVYVERVSGYDLWRARDLTVAARPIRWRGSVAKVAVVAVPHHDRSVLLPQLADASFDRLAEAHQVI